MTITVNPFWFGVVVGAVGVIVVICVIAMVYASKSNKKGNK